MWLGAIVLDSGNSEEFIAPRPETTTAPICCRLKFYKPTVIASKCAGKKAAPNQLSVRKAKKSTERAGTLSVLL